MPTNKNPSKSHTKHNPDSKFHPLQEPAIQSSLENVVHGSPNLNQSIHSNDIHKHSTIDPGLKVPTIITLRKDKGRQNVGMKKLLSDLRNGYSNDNSPSSVVSTLPSSHESRRHKELNSVMALIDSVTSPDEEGWSRHRMLTFSAKRIKTLRDCLCLS